MPNSGGKMSRIRTIGYHHGFTLIELMVTVAIIGIVALVAVPGMQALINSSRLNGQAGELVSALQLARSEAVRRNVRVVVCPTDGSSTSTTACSSSANWANWAILDLTKTVAADRVIRNATSNASVQVSGPAAGIVFGPSGLIDAQRVVTACIATTRPAENQRTLTVMVSGVVTTAKTPGGGVCP